jgi:hypothetical protein
MDVFKKFPRIRTLIIEHGFEYRRDGTKRREEDF